MKLFAFRIHFFAGRPHVRPPAPSLNLDYTYIKESDFRHPEKTYVIPGPDPEQLHTYVAASSSIADQSTYYNVALDTGEYNSYFF